MMKHSKINYEQLLDWLNGKMPASTAQIISQQVANDTALQADVAFLRQFLTASNELQLATPPPKVREILTRRFAAVAEARRPPSLFQRIVASLSFDSGLQLVNAGIRSASSEGQQRQLIYTSDQAEIALNLGDNQISGQIFPMTDVEPDDFSVQLVQGDDEIGLTMSDDLGEFVLGGVNAGDYELIVSGEAFEIVIDSLTV